VLSFFLLLMIAAIVLGLVGVVVKGLLLLLFIGIVVFLGALLLSALRMRRGPGRPRRASPLPNSDAALIRGSNVTTSSPLDSWISRSED
jgi:hypothetical protein